MQLMILLVGMIMLISHCLNIQNNSNISKFNNPSLNLNSVDVKERLVQVISSWLLVNTIFNVATISTAMTVAMLTEVSLAWQHARHKLHNF